MTPFVAELIGTAILVLLGNGVVANTLLKKSKASSYVDWALVSAGWGFAVFVAVEVAAPYSGAHLNPAVSIAFAIAGKFAWAKVPLYILAQLIGAMVGAFLVWFIYRDHFALTEDKEETLMCFATVPAVRRLSTNFFSEVIGTFLLLFSIFYIKDPSFSPIGATVAGQDVIGLGAIGALPVAFIVWGLVASIGGNTGPALNPARDFGPRLMHQLLPVSGTSDWSYLWVPVVGPIVGGVLAALLYVALAH